MKRLTRVLSLVLIVGLLCSTTMVHTKKGAKALSVNFEGLDRYVCNISKEDAKVYEHADSNSDVVGVLPKYHALKLLHKQDSKAYWKVTTKEFGEEGDCQYIKKSKTIVTGSKLADFIRKHPKQYVVYFKSKGVTGAYSTLYDLKTDNFGYEANVEFREKQDYTFYRNPYTKKYVKGKYNTLHYVHPTEDAVCLRAKPNKEDESVVKLATISCSYLYESEVGGFYQVKEDDKTYYIDKNYAEIVDVKEPIDNRCKKKYKCATLYPMIDDGTDFVKINLEDEDVYVEKDKVEQVYLAQEGSKASMVNNNYAYEVAEVGADFIKVREESEISDAQVYLYTDFDIDKNLLSVQFEGIKPIDEDSNGSNDTGDTPHWKRDSTGDTPTKYTLPKETATTDERDTIVEYAMSFLGHPYVYGGTDINHGIDCSAFQQYVLQHFGKSIGRCTSVQVKESAGRKIKIEDIKRGDLIYYTHDGVHPYHVVMYIGHGDCVHASCESAGVCIGQVNTSRILMVKNYID